MGMPKGKADIKRGGSQYKIKYIKKPKPNTKYKKNHFLHLTKTQNQNKSITNPKKKDLKPKPKKVLRLFTQKSAKFKNMKTIIKKHLYSLRL